jgi:5-formyltetrahydrofolate cyclo-ligase
MNVQKEELRRENKAIRLSMNREEVSLKSQIICQKLLSELENSNIKTVLVYQPIANLKEVDPVLFIEKVSGVKISTLQSSKDQKLPPAKYDLILVPTLAFDKNNYRLGWGGGFYDRLLVNRPQAQKIGLCFSNGFVSGGLPREPHDIPLDKIITEV